jgi:hypothetical protein
MSFADSLYFRVAGNDLHVLGEPPATQLLYVTGNPLFNTFSDFPISFPGKVEMVEKFFELLIIHGLKFSPL